MKNLKKITLVAAMFGCTISASVFAQTESSVKSAQSAVIDSYNPSWYIAPTANVVYPDTEFGINQDGSGGGLRIGKPVTKDWDIQFGTSYAHTAGNGLNYQQNLLGADGLYMFSRDTFRPFVLVGGGVQEDRLSASAGNSTSGYAPYLNVGLGFQAVINDQWSVQADLRRVHGFLSDNAFTANHDNNNYLMLSINYAFDKSPTRPIAVAPVPAPAPVVAPVAAPAPAPMVAPAPQHAPRFEKISFSATELFTFAKANLKMPQPKLDEIAAALNKNPQINHVVISGYTDRLGSDKYNQKLSEKRADAVKAYLVSKGVDAARLSAVGKGKANPVVVCTKTKHAELIKCLEPNRRVDVEQIDIERRVN